MPFQRTALASAIVGVCAGLGWVQSARAQVIPPAPLPPATVASGATTETAPVAPATYISPSVAVLATQTSNANFGTTGDTRADTILNVVPRLQFFSQHARWRLRGDFSVNGQYYARNTESAAALPAGAILFNSEPVEQLLHFDAGLSAQQNIINPYVSQSSANQYTTTQYNVHPYIDRRITPDLRFTAGSDDTWTNTSNVPADTGIYNGRYTVQSIGLEQRPTPFGYSLQAQQAETKYSDLPYSSLKDTTARAIANYALTNRLILGVIGGYEKVEAFQADLSKPIYGLRGSWMPNALGGVNATVEHRYFGTGWNLAANGGSNQLQFALNWTRAPSTFLQSINQSGTPASNLTTLLDGMLLQQYPDPLSRARAVQLVLAETGLPAGLATGNALFTPTTTLQNAFNVLALLIRDRNSFALSAFRVKSEDLILPGQTLLQALRSLPGNILLSSDNIQTGAAFNYGRRLTPITNLNVTLVRSINTGFGPNEGQDARQTSLFVQVDRRLSPNTIGLVGVRRQLLRSTIVSNSNESAIFAGLVHRF